MQGNLLDISIGLNGRQRLTIELNEDFRQQFEKLKDVPVDIDIKKHFNKRSKSANAYLHILVNKIAAELNEGNEEIKKKLVLEFGALAKDENGLTIGFKLPARVNAETIYPYTKCFDTRSEKGTLFKCYLVYKQTHQMDSKEMARLIDGAISWAKELGIETDTPEQLARYKEEWSKYGNNK